MTPSTGWRPPLRLLLFATLAVALAVGTGAAVSRARNRTAAPGTATGGRESSSKASGRRDVTEAERLDALRRAQVWRARAGSATSATRPGAWTAGKPLECRFIVDVPGGTAPKFDCAARDGRKLRVKYGSGPERHAETAATRLLATLGFGADRVQMVERLRCYGCPANPFVTMKTVGLVKADAIYAQVIDFGKHLDFDWVSIEERFPGESIETERAEGWAWFELDAVARRPGGATRAQLDAFRLLAIFLAHWDNKTENQRLVCLPGKTAADGRCVAPFAFIQDLGATFGPRKVNLDAWRRAPIWRDRGTCAVSMDDFPHHGGTFGQVRISEPGRRFLADLLRGLSDGDVEAIFSDARFQDYQPLLSSAGSITEWVQVFKSRVNQIADGPPCPAS